MDSMLKRDFVEFLNDPGMGIAHPGKDALSLKDFFVFPELLLPAGSPGGHGPGVLGSKELLMAESLPDAISVSGPEDSGKTSLLKILLIHYVENGFYPVYLDGNVTGPIGGTGLWELIRGSYEKQYNESYFTEALTSSSEKKLCLFDNFDKALSAPDLAQNLLESFKSLILTSEAPLLNALKLRDKSSMATAELSELTPLQRRELLKKWHAIGLSSAREKELKIEASFNLIENTLSQGLVPSYPSVLISMIYLRDTEDEYELSGGSYTHHLERVITKLLRESYNETEYEELRSLVSTLAYKMFSEQSFSVTASELDELLGKGSESIIPSLIRARIIVDRDTGYGFKYDHNYHYFTACYLEKNLASQGVRQCVQSLCQNLGESDNANIMLFLVHLSGDPFITQEINRALENSLSEVSEDLLDERVSELDEIIDSIINSEQKDKKLREIRAEYEAPVKRPWAPDRLTRVVFERSDISGSKEIREGLSGIRKELNLLRVSGALLKKRLSQNPESSDTKSLAKAYYRMWTRSLSQALLSLAIEPYGRTEDSSTYESKSGNEEYLLNNHRFSTALKICRLYIKELSQTLCGSNTSQLFTDDEYKVPEVYFSLIDICSRTGSPDNPVKLEEIEQMLSSKGRGPFLKEALREALHSRYRNLYHGEELRQMISELNRALKF